MHLRTLGRRAAIAMVAVLGLVLALIPAQTANAAGQGWTTLESGGSRGVLLACKIARSGGYGPVWEIRLVLANAQHVSHTSARVDVLRPGHGRVSRTNMSTSRKGQWDVDTTYASRWYPDYIYATASFAPNTGGGGKYSMSQIGYC